MNSFIAWIGGKKLLRKEIVKRFPEVGFTRYVEVFGGAGWVLFEKRAGKRTGGIQRPRQQLDKLISVHQVSLRRTAERAGMADYIAGTVL